MILFGHGHRTFSQACRWCNQCIRCHYSHHLGIDIGKPHGLSFCLERIVLNKKLLNFFIFIVDAQLYSFSISWLDMAIYDFFHMFFFIFTRAAILVSVEQFDDFGFILLVYLFMLGVHEFLNLVVYHRYGKIIID